MVANLMNESMAHEQPGRAGLEVVDTFAEAFPMTAARVIVTPTPRRGLRSRARR